MAKELYLYQPIWSYTAQTLITELEANSREDIVLRVNSPGGSVFNSWGIIAKIQEKKAGTLTMKVDGAAMSMSAKLLFWADKVIALDVSNIMIHRADGPVSTPADQAFLDKVNKDLRGKMEKRINSPKLKELKGYTVAEIFEAPQRVDINLTAQEAKAVGIVDEIFELSPREIEANASAYQKYFSIAADNTPKTQTMTIDQIKAQFPEVYAAIMKQGATLERDRVQAWAHFSAVDPEAVQKGIAGGEPISQLQMIEFMEKKANGTALSTLKGEAGANTTDKGTKATTDDKVKQETDAIEAKKKETAEFFNNVNSFTGVKVF